jgi:hypothetical protein
MKKFVLGIALVAAYAPSAFAGSDVAVSIGINQPGVYGRIDIGNMPPPAVVYAQPVVVAPAPVAVYQQPIYLYVPPTHQANWGRYCGRYAACGQPVYFVHETWVHEHARRGDGDDRYADRGERHGDKHGRGRKRRDD